MQSAQKSQTRAGGKPLQIVIGNLVLLRDHPEGQNKIQVNYEFFVVISHHQDPSEYVFQFINKKGRKWMVNR